MMRLSAVMTAVVLLLTGCDSGPRGPGQFQAEVRAVGIGLGGAVVQVAGVGIDGFSGAEGSKVYWAPMGTADSYRVIVVQEQPGDLHFQVSVQNLGGQVPTAAVVSLVNGENFRLPVTNQYSVRFSR